MKYTADQIGKHEFEVSGCGVAPFTFMYVWQLPSPALMEGIGGVEAYNNAMKSAPCSVGSCKHCGMPLIYHYIIKDANGKLFAVGCSCVEKTGDAGLIEAVATEKKRQAAVKKAEKAAARQATKAEKEAARIQENIQRIANQYPEVFAFLSAEVEKEDCQPIWKSFMYQVKTFGNLSENQIKCVEKAIQKASEPVLVSKHVGVLGQRQIFSQVKIEAIITVPCQSFGYNDRSSIDLYIMKDKDGNNLFYKTKAIVKDKNTGDFAQTGDIFDITATVKEHGFYKDAAQTIIQRPTWKKVG